MRSGSRVQGPKSKVQGLKGLLARAANCELRTANSPLPPSSPSSASLRLCVKSLLLFSLLLTADAADTATSLFEEGNRRYQRGEYEAALQTYQQILDSGQASGELYYNLGNCHYKLGDLGRTILNYERALRWMPGDEDITANLELMYSQTADDITPLPVFWPLRLLDAWLHLVPRPALTVLVAALYVLSMAFLIALVLSRSLFLTVWSRRAVLVSALLLMVFGLTLASVHWQSANRLEGVILVEEVVVQSAPSDDEGLEVFTIHEGAKVRIDQQAGEWAEIVLQDGKVGWVKMGAFEVI